MFNYLVISCAVNTIVGGVLLAALLEINRWKGSSRANREACDLLASENEKLRAALVEAVEDRAVQTTRLGDALLRVNGERRKMERFEQDMSELIARAYVREGRAYRKYAR